MSREYSLNLRDITIMVYNLLVMVICDKCGAENRVHAHFCRSCGQTLPDQVEANPEMSPIDHVGAPLDQQDQTLISPRDQLIGQHLARRYHVLRLVEGDSDVMLYEARDLWRCPSCRAVQSAGHQQFCEVCGAELLSQPLVLIRASRLETETPGMEHGDALFVDGILYQVEESPGPIDVEPSIPVFRLVSGFQNHPGKVRENNEDSLITLQLAGMCDLQCAPGLGFFAIADGVGGSASGEIASKTAVSRLAQGAMQQIFAPELSGTPLSLDEISKRLHQMVLEANQAIIDLRNQANMGDLGSTLTAVIVSGTQAVVANVGDSRTYRLSQGKLTQITQDHSMVARLLEQGLIQPEEVYVHQQRNVIYRSLGSRQDLEVDLFSLDLEPGERLMLCSDGIWEMIHEPMMEQVLLERFDPQQACDRLVELANLAGGQDNLSIIIIDLRGHN
jgi:serine/threonine protein phosphatase PrpC/ribosomal protein L40E